MEVHMIIFAGIVARFPEDVLKSIYQVQQGLVNGYVSLALVSTFYCYCCLYCVFGKG